MFNYKISNINSFTNEELNFFYNQINLYKKDIISKCKNPIRIKQSIIGELLLKELLEDNYNIDYKDLDFTTNKCGKPFINNKNIYFNMSHSYSYVVCITSNNIIGIDIEKIRKTNIKTINTFATSKEKEYILSSKDDIQKRLFEIYTLKEAYLKMKGTRLNQIKNVEFIINKDKINCSDKNTIAYFINDIDGYIIAVCKYKKKELI